MKKSDMARPGWKSGSISGKEEGLLDSRARRTNEFQAKTRWVAKKRAAGSVARYSPGSLERSGEYINSPPRGRLLWHIGEAPYIQPMKLPRRSRRISIRIQLPTVNKSPQWRDWSSVRKGIADIGVDNCW